MGSIDILVTYPNPVLPKPAWYNQEEIEDVKKRTAGTHSLMEDTRGKTHSPRNNLEDAGPSPGSTILSELLRPRSIIPRLDILAWDISARCQVWAQAKK